MADSKMPVSQGLPKPGTPAPEKDREKDEEVKGGKEKDSDEEEEPKGKGPEYAKKPIDIKAVAAEEQKEADKAAAKNKK